MNEKDPEKKPQRIRLTARDKYYLYEYGGSCAYDGGWVKWRQEWNERLDNAPENDRWKNCRM